MDAKETKQKILNAALKLFSIKGFDGVSIDEIGKEVGIKGPSIYRYFRCKEDIFLQIYDQINDCYVKVLDQQLDLNNLPDTLQEYCQHGINFITYTTSNKEVVMGRKILTLEQFKNKQIARFYTDHQITLLVKKHEIAISRYMDMGLIKKGDPQVIAFELIAPISLLIQLSDRNEYKKEEIIEMAKKHFEYFIEKNKNV